MKHKQCLIIVPKHSESPPLESKCTLHPKIVDSSFQNRHMKADQQNRVPRQKLWQLDFDNPLKGTRKDGTSLVFDVTTSLLYQKINLTNNN